MTPDQIEQEGRDAFKRGAKASECPYTFDRTRFYPKDYEGFNTVRWKLDAWMDGWLDEQKKARAK